MAEEELPERIRHLHAQLDDRDIHSVDYKRRSNDIHEPARAYGKLADARQGIGRPDTPYRI